MIRRLILPLCAALAASAVAAQDGVRPTIAAAPAKRASESAPGSRRTETQHRVLIGRGMSVDDARTEAIAQAQQKAVAAAFGVEVTGVANRVKSETNGDVDDSYVSVVQQNVAGRVTDFQILSEGIESFPAPGGGPPQNYYGVKISAEVTPEVGRTDPGFQLSVALNAPIYYDRGNPYLNDDFVTNVRVSEDAWITIFYVSENQVQVLFPNPYEKNPRAVAGRPASFPSEQLRNGLGLRARVDPIKNGKRTRNDLLIVVATKTRIPFDAGALQPVTGAGQVATITSNALALNRWLARIPLDQRVVGHAVVEVRRQERP